MSCYRYLPYTLTLGAPAVITALGGDPNSSLCLPFIPGAAIRGAMAGRLGNSGTDNVKEEEFYELVLGGKVRYLHAYPAQNDRRALPIPVSVRLKKEAQKRLENIAAGDLAAYPSLEGNAVVNWPKEQLVAPAENFLTIGSSRLTLVQPERSTRIHHQRDSKGDYLGQDKQIRNHGAIFFFESLDAGQSFKGLLQIRGESEEECEQLAKRVQTLLKEEIFVGRSKRAGYGGMAKIEWDESRKNEVEGAGTDGFQPITCDIEPDMKFRLLLTSACIVRNPDTGQIDPGALKVLISRYLEDKVEWVCSRWAFATVGGFNRKWRLETPQALAVAAGSVVVLKAKQPILIDELYRVEHEGLGERREEGYGRVLFLKEGLSPQVFLHQEKKALSSFLLGKNPPQLVSIIEKRIIDVQIIKQIEEKALSIAKSAKNLPSSSLLGRLRTPLRNDPEKALKTIKDWLQEGDKDKCLKRAAMDQLNGCFIEWKNRKHSLLEWLMEAIDENKILDWLQTSVIAQRGHLISEKSAMNFLHAKSEELSVRLIDALFSAMALRNKKKEADDE